MIVSSFSRAENLVNAAQVAHSRGYRTVDARTPFPVSGLPGHPEELGSRLTTTSLLAALTALVAATWVCLWTSSVSWPINVGGKPWNSLPAYVPVIFEVTILAAALAPASLFLLGLRLQKSAPIESGLNDEFVLLLEATDSRTRPEEIIELMNQNSAISTKLID